MLTIQEYAMHLYQDLGPWIDQEDLVTKLLADKMTSAHLETGAALGLSMIQAGAAIALAAVYAENAVSKWEQILA